MRICVTWRCPNPVGPDSSNQSKGEAVARNHSLPTRADCIGLWSNVAALQASLLYVVQQENLHDGCPDNGDRNSGIFLFGGDGISRVSGPREMQCRIEKVQ